MTLAVDQAQANSTLLGLGLRNRDDHGLLLKRLHELSNEIAASLEIDDTSSKDITSGKNPVAVLPSAPTAKDLKRIIQFRANRRRMDTGEFFEWPAWDMLLDLAAVQMEGRKISVSAVCISSGAPQSTALRKMSQLENAGLIRRYQHDRDRRRICVVLTESGIRLVHETLQEDRSFYCQLSA